MRPWLIIAAANAVIFLALGVAFGWPLLYVLAPLAFSVMAAVDIHPRSRAWLERWWSGPPTL